jgi:chitodextrinase
MKKISIVIISLFAFSFLSATALATSGACSDHGGVDCSAGAQANGNVVCNDGWTGSSVSYSSMDECQATMPVCNYPFQPSCSLSAIQQQEQNALNSAEIDTVMQGGLGSPSGAALSLNIQNTYSLEYSQCQSQWTAYQSQLTGYNTCIQSPIPSSAPLNEYDLADACVTNEEFTHWDFSSHSCVCNGTGARINGVCTFESLFATPISSSQINLTWLPFTGLSNIGLSKSQVLRNGIVIVTTASTSYEDDGLAADTAYLYTVVAYDASGIHSQTATTTATTYTAPSSSSMPASNPSAPVATSTPIFTSFLNLLAVNQNLKTGSSGNDVISLQKFLEAKGILTLPAGTTEGYFGSLTKKALISFQISVGLPATGYFGPMTRAAINGS